MPVTTYRDLHAVLPTLGYWLARQTGGHYVYKHRHQSNFTLPMSPSDHRAFANDLALLRRRHPNAEVLKPQQRSTRGGRRRRSPSDLRRKTRRAALYQAPQSPPRFERPDCTSCIDCGRPWLSDLDPLQHCCPACGGEIVLGREVA